MKPQKPISLKAAILLLFITGIFYANSAFSQTYSSLINDEEIYSFLNWVTKNDKRFYEEPKLKAKQVHWEIISWNTDNFICKDSALFGKYPFYEPDNFYIYSHSMGVDTLFKTADKTFLFEQFTSIKDTVWHKPFSRSKLLKEGQSGTPNSYHYSIPLFSLDRKYVIVFKSYYCGSLCAYGGYYLYTKTGDKKWKFLFSINNWVS